MTIAERFDIAINGPKPKQCNYLYHHIMEYYQGVSKIRKEEITSYDTFGSTIQYLTIDSIDAIYDYR